VTGTVVGVIVGVVAVAAWVGGRRWGAGLPRKTDHAAGLPRKSDQAALNFPETHSKVIQGASEGESFPEKVIATGGGEIARAKPAAGSSPSAEPPAQQTAVGGARSEGEIAREKNSTTGCVPAEGCSEPSTPSGEESSDPPPPARVLVGARPDAGTTLCLEAPPSGWAKWVYEDREDGQVLDAAGRTVEVSLRGSGDEVVELRARGQMRLLIWDDHAELVVGSRALDTLGGIEGWAREWVAWASAYLIDAQLDRSRPLESADELGWSPTAVDLAADLAGWGPLRDEHQDPDRWTQQTVPLPVPAGQGQLASIQLGEKSSNPLSIYGYDKTRRAERTGRGVAWLERMRQAGRQPGEAVWRWELRLRNDALQLRRRGADEVLVDFRRCATLADQAAIARAWTHAFGNPDADKPTGHYRLTVAADRFDDKGRGYPLTRTRALDPQWRLVQTAGGEAPVERLSQVRERKEAARAQWRAKAEETALRGLAATVALDHDDPEHAAEAALERARELVSGERWTEAHARQRAATHDLRDDPEWRYEPMSTQLPLVDADPAPELLPDPPRWTRRPVDAAERWKRRELEHHPFSAVVRMMNAAERERTRASMRSSGYDREWPIVLYEGKILDGRNRDAIAFELWRQSERECFVPSFVELVPEEPARADEAALLYVQQRLSATRNLGEGERVAAAYKLFRLYRDRRAKVAESERAGRSASAREAAAVAGVSPRSIERYAYVDERAGEVFGDEGAAELLEAIDRGEVSIRAAERRVKAAFARAEAERVAEQLAVAGTEVSAEIPDCAGEVVLDAPGVRLVRADALALLRSLPDGCVETAFFDGPYVLGSGGTTNKGGERVAISPGDWDAQWRSPEHYFDAFLRPVAEQLERVLSPTGEVWASGTRHVLFALERALSTMRSYRLYQDICWQKTSPPPRLHPQSGWTDDHELLLWYRARDERHARRDVTGAKALVGSHATWTITRPSSAEARFGRHPTQKPERLLEAVLAAHQGLVLDFCAGSCTTAVAALRRGRPVLCADLEAGEGYLATGRLRVLHELAAREDEEPR
jgi:site-specific DNA-methyltransferase (adenine-specific)